MSEMTWMSWNIQVVQNLFKQGTKNESKDRRIRAPVRYACEKDDANQEKK